MSTTLEPGFHPVPETAPAPTPDPSSPAPSPAPGPPGGARPLNRCQEKFCVQYAISGNAAEAARLAGYARRYARNHGHRLAKDARVRDRVLKLRVGMAFDFGPAKAFARLEELYAKACAAKRFRTAASILTMQVRLVALESVARPRAEEGRGCFGITRPDPFDDLIEQ